MIVRFTLLSVILFGVLSASPVLAQNRPICQSANSDSDGDGFGWENEQSCVVVADQLGQCEDRGGFPWGWNPVTETSCRLDEQSTGGAGACLDSDGDGFGWNGVATCLVGGSTDLELNAVEDLFLGTWVCQSQYVALADDYEPDLSSGLLRTLGSQMSWIGYEFPSQGSPIPVTSDRQLLTLNDDKTVELSNWIYDSFPSTRPFTELSDSWPQAGSWSEANSGSWAIEDLRLLLSVTGESGRFSLANSIQFDSTDSSNPAIYFYSDITTRVACLHQ